MKINRKEFYLFILFFCIAIIVVDLLCDKGAFPAKYIVPGIIIVLPLLLELDIFLGKYFANSKKENKHGI